VVVEGGEVVYQVGLCQLGLALLRVRKKKEKKHDEGKRTIKRFLNGTSVGGAKQKEGEEEKKRIQGTQYIRRGRRKN